MSAILWRSDIPRGSDIYNSTSTQAMSGIAVASAVSSKSDSANPVFTGSFSLGRGDNSAIGEGSFACGTDVVATASGAHAEGEGTIASYQDQHVQGRYNIADNTSAFIIGNGSSDEDRSNALTVDWGGNVVASGNLGASNHVEIGNTSSEDKQLIFYDKNRSTSGAAAWIGFTNSDGTFYIWDNANGKSILTSNAAGTNTFNGNAATATKLATARTLTIGSTGKTFDGTAAVSWTLAEIGASPSDHTHTTISNNLTISGSLTSTGALYPGNIVIKAGALIRGYDDADKTGYHDIIDNSVDGTTQYIGFGSPRYHQRLYAGDGTDSHYLAHTATYFRPSVTETVALGGSSNRWNGVYSTTGNFKSDVTVSGSLKAGNIGTIKTATAMSANLTLSSKNTVYRAQSISLTAGVWIVKTRIRYNAPSSNGMIKSQISSTDKDQGFGGSVIYMMLSGQQGIIENSIVVNISATTTFYTNISSSVSNVTVNKDTTELYAVQIK